MDDLLIWRRNEKEHNDRLTAVLKQIERAGATLNPNNCEFSNANLKIVGHPIGQEGMQADPDKTATIVAMKPQENFSEL